MGFFSNLLGNKTAKLADAEQPVAAPEVEEKKAQASVLGEEEEKRKKKASPEDKEGEDKKRAVAGIDISKAHSFSDVKDIFSKSSKEGLFVVSRSEDGITETHTDPKVLAAVMKANGYKGSKEDFIKEVQSGDISISEKDQQKLADNTVTYTLNKDNTVKDMTSGKEVNSVGIIDGNVIKITNGKSKTLFKENETTKDIVQKEPPVKAAGKDAGKDVAAEKPAGHKSANPLDMENGSAPEPQNVVAAVKLGHVTKEKGQAMMDALQRDDPKAKAEEMPAQGEAKAKSGVALPTKPPAALGGEGPSTSAPPPGKVATQTQGRN